MRIWQLHFTRNNHQQTGQRCHKENSSSLQLHSHAIRGKYSCRGAKSEPVISTVRTQGRVKKCQQLNQHPIGEQQMTENYIVNLVAWIILYASFWLTKHSPVKSYLSPIYHDDRVIWDRFWMQRNGSTVCAKNAQSLMMVIERFLSNNRANR